MKFKKKMILHNRQKLTSLANRFSTSRLNLFLFIKKKSYKWFNLFRSWWPYNFWKSSSIFEYLFSVALQIEREKKATTLKIRYQQWYFLHNKWNVQVLCLINSIKFEIKLHLSVFVCWLVCSLVKYSLFACYTYTGP